LIFLLDRKRSAIILTREDARKDINSRLQSELTKARKKISGHDTYICPFCGNGSGSDGTGISTKDGKHYTCFKGCFLSIDYLDILKQKHGTDNELDIFSLYNLTIEAGQPRPSVATIEQPRTDYKTFFLQAQKDLSKSPEALSYLQGRGISPEIADLFMLGYCHEWRSPEAVKNGKNPPSSPRIIIPTSAHSYLARDIRPDANKSYKAMKEGAAELFNAKALQGDVPIFITEGEIDAISVVEVGGQAIALGSTSNTEKLIELCKKEPPAVPLILSLDNDEPGRRAQDKLKAGLEALKIPVYEINTSGEYKDPNEHLIANRAAFTALVNSGPEQAAEAKKEKYLATAAAYHINAFMGEIAASADTPAIPTGYDKLDDALDGGLYEGLYVVGAISSLGKTTFILQAADQIAQKGFSVLVFSLEMSRYELMAKSISRLTLLNCNGNRKNAKTTRGILSGAKRRYYSQEEKDLINESIASYSGYSERVYIHEGMGTIGVEQVREEVQKHISFTGNAPVVIIDYLQILAPYDMRATDKQNTDKAVLELKRLSRDKKIPIIAISSFNRDNYTASVNLASFKESGAIEYSSDVLLGMQLDGMDEISQSEGKRADAIRQIESKKRADPRKAQLKILKNRNGKIGISLYFDYYPMFNYFNETASTANTEG
jgi:replicative DNA helicase